MGNTDSTEDAIDARRAFVQRLRAHEDVHRVNFSRNGFGLVVIELEPDADFRSQGHRTAIRLGYTVEQQEPGESRPDDPTDVWIRGLTESEDSADRSTWESTVRRAVS